MPSTSKKKTSTKKAATKKSPAKKSAAKKKTGAKKTRKYGPKAAASVRTAMEEMKGGTLRSGGSGDKVTDPKQAIAIGLSEARRSGAKVPKNPKK